MTGIGAGNNNNNKKKEKELKTNKKHPYTVYNMRVTVLMDCSQVISY